jgi:hypothetical protein
MLSISWWAVIITWLRFMPSSMIRAVSFPAAAAGPAAINAEAAAMQDARMIPPKNKTAGALFSTPAA